MNWQALEQEALDLFRGLLRVDTSNPPGRETEACRLVAESLAADGIQVRILEKEPGRGNLVAVLDGQAPASERLVLSGHLDVVPTQGQDWSLDPFGAQVKDGLLYGRGAVDMKHMVAMSVMVLKILKRSGRSLSRGLVLALVADEEVGGGLGASYLVDEHPDLVMGRYLLGEVGGLSLRMGSRPLVPVQVAEKGRVLLRIRAKGPSGHGSLPQPDSALVRLAGAMERLGLAQLPFHPTTATRDFLAGLAAAAGPIEAPVLRGLAHPVLGPRLLRLTGDRRRLLQSLLSNTATPTVFRAGRASNVVPEEAEALVDGRYLPGQTKADLVAEVRRVLGPDFIVEAETGADPVEVRPYRTELYEIIEEQVQAHWPEALVVPSLTPGYTDAKHFSRLGMACYGFTPVRMPPDLSFAELFHAPDERIPVEGFLWGLRVLHDVAARYCRPS